MKRIAVVAIFLSILPVTVSAQYYGFDPGIQQRTQDMMQNQLEMQQQQLMHQDRMLQEQQRQMQLDRIYQQQRSDNMRRNSNYNNGIPPLGGF